MIQITVDVKPMQHRNSYPMLRTWPLQDLTKWGSKHGRHRKPKTSSEVAIFNSTALLSPQFLCVLACCGSPKPLCRGPILNPGVAVRANFWQKRGVGKKNTRTQKPLCHHERGPQGPLRGRRDQWLVVTCVVAAFWFRHCLALPFQPLPDHCIPQFHFDLPICAWQCFKFICPSRIWHWNQFWSPGSHCQWSWPCARQTCGLLRDRLQVIFYPELLFQFLQDIQLKFICKTKTPLFINWIVGFLPVVSHTTAGWAPDNTSLA